MTSACASPDFFVQPLRPRRNDPVRAFVVAARARLEARLAEECDSRGGAHQATDDMIAQHALACLSGNRQRYVLTGTFH